MSGHSQHWVQINNPDGGYTVYRHGRPAYKPAYKRSTRRKPVKSYYWMVDAALCVTAGTLIILLMVLAV